MKPGFKSTIIAAAIAGVTAAIINSILYFLFLATGLISNSVFVQDGQPITVLPVIISSLIPSLLAGVVFYLLSRYTTNGYRIFSIIAIILLVISFANPFMAIEGVPLKMAIALNVMHIVVVASLLYFFKRIMEQGHTVYA
jgi:uncharacterized membrane protein YvlD (DUF360 family)